MFNWFKKKKEEEESNRPYDPTSVRLIDLKKGAFLDYDFKTWQVTACYEYDWGDDFFTDEFQLNSEDELVYLHVEEDGVLNCVLQRKIPIRSIDTDVSTYIIKNDTAPAEIQYNGVVYYKRKEAPGYFRNTDQDAWRELIAWTYLDESESKVLTIEQWGNEEFEATAGMVVSEFKFSNLILP